MADGSVVFDTKLDSSGLENGLKQLDGSLNCFGKSVAQSASEARQSLDGIGNAALETGKKAEKLSDDLQSSISETAAVFKTSGAKISAALDLQTDFSEIETDLTSMSADFEKHAGNARRSLSGISAGASDAQNSLEILSGKAREFGGAVTYHAAEAARALYEFGKESVGVYKDFQDSMLRVKATMAASESDYERLSAFAREMGATTRYSASEAADALNYLALAGYDAEKAIAVLPQVLSVAQAGGLDLARAADFITDNMSALGLEIQDLDKFSDMLARTSQKSNTSIGQLGEALQTAAGPARSAGQNLSEINAVLGVLADNGLKGAEAGTAYRNILVSLAAPAGKAELKLKELGVSVYDSAGKMRQLSDIMRDMQSALSRLTQEDRINVLNDIFNRFDLNAAQFMLSSTTGEFAALKAEIDNSAGAAREMAATMEQGLGGALRNFESFLEEQMLQLGEALETPVTDALTVIQEKIAEVMPELVRKLEEILPQAGETLAEVLPLLIELGADALPAVAAIVKILLPLVQLFSEFVSANTEAIKFWLPLVLGVAGAVKTLTGVLAFFKTVGAITAGLSAVMKGIEGVGTAAQGSAGQVGSLLTNLKNVASATGSKIAGGAVSGPLVLGTAVAGAAAAGAKIGVAIDPDLDDSDLEAFFGKTGEDFFYKAMNAWTGGDLPTPSEKEELNAAQAARSEAEKAERQALGAKLSAAANGLDGAYKEQKSRIENARTPIQTDGAQYAGEISKVLAAALKESDSAAADGAEVQARAARGQTDVLKDIAENTAALTKSRISSGGADLPARAAGSSRSVSDFLENPLAPLAEAVSKISNAAPAPSGLAGLAEAVSKISNAAPAPSGLAGLAEAVTALLGNLTDSGTPAVVFTPQIASGTILPYKAQTEVSALSSKNTLPEAEITTKDEVLDDLHALTAALKNQKPINVAFNLDGIELKNYILNVVQGEIRDSNGRLFQ
jgi:TP901 family phage tail tape measure protein